MDNFFLVFCLYVVPLVYLDYQHNTHMWYEEALFKIMATQPVLDDVTCCFSSSNEFLHSPGEETNHMVTYCADGRNYRANLVSTRYKETAEKRLVVEYKGVHYWTVSDWLSQNFKKSIPVMRIGE